MADSQFTQLVRVSRGPTLGDQWVAVAPISIINAAGTVTLGTNSSRVLVSAAGPVTVNLPDVQQWILQSFDGMRPAFDQSIWIKDMSGNAHVNNISVVPFGTQAIDGRNQPWTIVEDFFLLRLWPLTDFSGWYTG